MAPEVYRLAVISSRPQPYHSSFYRALAAHLRIDLTVYYLFDVGVGEMKDADFGRFRSDYPLLEGYPSRFLPNRAPWPDNFRFTGSFHPELLSRLQLRHHDAALIHGWFGLSVWLAHLACGWRGLPVLMRSDANAADPPRRGWPHAKSFVLPRLLRRCRAVLVVGTRNAEFYRRFGVPEEKMFFVPHAVDNDFFQQHRAALQPQREEIRRQFGLPPEAVVVLYAGRVAPEKGLEDLLAAVRRLADPRAWLVLAGEGRSRQQLEQQARLWGLTQMLFPGLQGQQELARWYTAADIFVLPSKREPWGLVVNEAMNFALPVVVSDVVGAVPDLVENEGNGLVFPAGDVEALARCLQWLVANPARRLQMAARSLEKIRNWSHQNSAETLLRALEYAFREQRT